MRLKLHGLWLANLHLAFAFDLSLSLVLSNGTSSLTAFRLIFKEIKLPRVERNTADSQSGPEHWWCEITSLCGDVGPGSAAGAAWHVPRQIIEVPPRRFLWGRPSLYPVLLSAPPLSLSSK